jgi:hypothetical protein
LKNLVPEFYTKTLKKTHSKNYFEKSYARIYAQNTEVKIWIVDDINTQTRRVLTNTENNAGSTKGQHPVLTRGHVDDHRRGVDKSEKAYRPAHPALVQEPTRLEEPARKPADPGDALGVRGDGYR